MKPLRTHRVIVEARIRTTFDFDIYEDEDSMESSIDVAVCEQEHFARACGENDEFQVEVMGAEVLKPE